jgi:hypothetical protein
MTAAEGWTCVIATQLLALAAGFAYGRQQVVGRERKQVGFPVIMKDHDMKAAKRSVRGGAD